MYRKHVAFTAFPFDRTPAPDELFVSTSLTEADVRLKHLLELRGGRVTGDAGSGKTTVCRKGVADLHPGLYRVFYVPLSTGNVMDMYKSIIWELGLPTERNRAAAFRVIRAEITRLILEAKQRPVLIVDEAHHLRNDVLEIDVCSPTIRWIRKTVCACCSLDSLSYDDVCQWLSMNHWRNVSSSAITSPDSTERNSPSTWLTAYIWQDVNCRCLSQRLSKPSFKRRRVCRAR